MRTHESAVKQVARAKALELYQPESLKNLEAQERIAAARPDALVVAAYGLLLPQRVLDIAPRGAINIHASLLPRWRGAAPIQRALLAGDAETGISIMQMDAGLDTGPVLARHALPILPEDDFGTLHDRLAALGARAIVEALASEARPEPQPEAGATYAKKLAREEEAIDWSRSCEEIERKVRALRPMPGVRTHLGSAPLKIWRARCAARAGAPGSVLEASNEGILVGCGAGSLQVTELQRAGGKRLLAAEFLRGTPISPGDRLGPAR
jgi:methionyl-tRNA formyltransferase